ncbi:MAG TPA: hypothetical protein PLD75_00920 [Spirochaetota bacterium]|nr:hypothetical protein [Spirochaetota bacterium]
MKHFRILGIIILLFLSTNLFSVEFKFIQHNFYFSMTFYNDTTSDLTDDKNKKENPILKDIDFSWFKEKYRLEKILISSGIITMTIGLPLLIVGIVNYFLPLADKSYVSDLTSLSLIGVGSGLIGCGGIVMIVGVIRFNVLKNKEKSSTSFSIGISPAYNNFNNFP